MDRIVGTTIAATRTTARTAVMILRFLGSNIPIFFTSYHAVHRKTDSFTAGVVGQEISPVIVE